MNRNEAKNEAGKLLKKQEGSKNKLKTNPNHPEGQAATSAIGDRYPGNQIALFNGRAALPGRPQVRWFAPHTLTLRRAKPLDFCSILWPRETYPYPLQNKEVR